MQKIINNHSSAKLRTLLPETNNSSYLTLIKKPFATTISLLKKDKNHKNKISRKEIKVQARL